MRFIFNKKVKRDKNKKSPGTPPPAIDEHSTESLTRIHNNEDSSEYVTSYTVEPIPMRNDDEHKDIKETRKSSDPQTRIHNPFRIRRASEHHDQCCEHQQEIDNLRLLVMKLNRRLYFAEVDTPSGSNDSLLAQKPTPDWIKEPEETCALLERAEKRLEQQTVLLNEYESTIEVLRNNLESVTVEKEKLAEELASLRAEHMENPNGINHSPTFDHMLWDPSGNTNTDNILKENQKLAEFIHEKHKHDVKMYRLVGDQLQQMMQQVYQLASRKSSVASESLPSTSFERINQTPITIYYKDKRHKHGFGRLSRKSDRHAATVLAEGDLSQMANKLEDIEKQMNLLTNTIHSRRLSHSQPIHHT